MSGGKGGGEVQRVEPPRYQLPYLQAGLQRAEGLYSGGAPQNSQPTSNSSGVLGRFTGTGGILGQVATGQPYVNGGALGSAPTAGFSPDQQYSQGMIRNRAVGGDPTIGSAQDYVQTTLNGGFLNSNPYLDQTFNRAAMATQGQLASQFAGAGRNVDQSQGQRSQQLNDLASQIYGGNYANERNLMQSALGYAQPLGNQTYTDAAQLGASGAQQQGQLQRQLDAPGTALDQYLARVRGTDYGSTTRQPGGSALSGAAGGALAGSAFGPWGAGIGGLIGLFGG